MNRLKDGSSCQEGSSTGCTAGDFICQQNGFEYAEFVGTKDSYLDFIKGIIKQILKKWTNTIHISHTGYRPEVISQIRPPQTNFVRIYPLDGRFKLNGCKSLSFRRGQSPTLEIVMACRSTTRIFYSNQKIIRSCIQTNLELIFDNSIPRLRHFKLEFNSLTWGI